MLTTLYINSLPVDTLREFDKVVYVEIVKLWKTLRIREYIAPIPESLQIITKQSDNAYVIGRYATKQATINVLQELPPEAYEDPSLGATMLAGLETVLSMYWDSQPEFTPLKH